jgi:hypothetical protein
MRDSFYEVAHDRATGLRIQLARRTYVFPWSQFLFAEGDADEIRLAFSTHDIQITGGRLDALLPDIVAQRVTLLREPMRADSFAPEAAPRITGIAVRKVE